MKEHNDRLWVVDIATQKPKLVLLSEFTNEGLSFTTSVIEFFTQHKKYVISSELNEIIYYFNRSRKKPQIVIKVKNLENSNLPHSIIFDKEFYNKYQSREFVRKYNKNFNLNINTKIKVSW